MTGDKSVTGADTNSRAYLRGATALYVSAMWSMRSTINRVAASLAALVVSAACSPGPAPISSSLHDPSNPAAPEGTTPRVESAPVRAPGGEHHGHHHAGMLDASPGAPNTVDASPVDASPVEGGAPGVLYVCPMHPDVTSSVPGRCPKCNMNLAPKRK